MSKSFTEHTGKGVDSIDTLHEELPLSNAEGNAAVSNSDGRQMTGEQLLRYQAEAELHDVRERLRIAEEALERFGFFRYRSPLGWHPPAGKDKLSTLFRLTHDNAALEQDRNRWMEMHGDMVALNNSLMAENAKITNERDEALIKLEACDAGLGMERAFNALNRSEIERKHSALHVAGCALADIGDADRDPEEGLDWCEKRAAEAMPAVRAALSPANAGSRKEKGADNTDALAYLILPGTAKGRGEYRKIRSLAEGISMAPVAIIWLRRPTAQERGALVPRLLLHNPKGLEYFACAQEATSAGNPADHSPNTRKMVEDDAGTVGGATRATMMFVDKYVEKYQTPEPPHKGKEAR